MHWRTITIDGTAYRYSVGRSSVVVRENIRGGKTICCLDAGKVAGIEDWERARWKRYAAITPAMVEAAIRNHKE